MDGRIPTQQQSQIDKQLELLEKAQNELEQIIENLEIRLKSILVEIPEKKEIPITSDEIFQNGLCLLAERIRNHIWQLEKENEKLQEIIRKLEI